MAGGSVEALALVHQRVVAARDRVERHRNVRSHLLGIGEVAAASRSTARIRELDLDLSYLESVLVAVTAQVRHDFNTMLLRAGADSFADELLSGASAAS